jgi:hypothetical protein
MSGPADNPFTAPAVAAPAVVAPPAIVRWGGALALVAEIGLPLSREGAVWLGWVTAHGTLWVGVLMVVLQALAASLLVWPARVPGRSVVAVVGAGAVVVVASATVGRLADRWVPLASGLALGGLELSQGVGAAAALRRAGRSRWTGLATVGVVATAVGTALIDFRLGALRPLVVALWIGGRLVRYATLARVAAG